MILYFSILIPITAVIILFFFYKKKLTLAEYIIVLLPNIVAIIIIYFISIHSQTSDVEILGEYITHTIYYEPWDEYIQNTCYKDVPCGTDSDGNTIYCTESYDCSYVDFHPKRFIIYMNTGHEYSISEVEYLNLRSKWNNNKFVEMNRDYHSIDGNAYRSDWNLQLNDLNYNFYTQTYENRIQASNSIFRSEDIDTSFYKGLYDISKDETMCFYAHTKTKKIANAEEFLRKQNALLGKTKQVRMQILLLKNKDITYSTAQQSYWNGGNKNEFNVIVNIDNENKIDWVYSFSWCEDKRVEVFTNDDIQKLKYFNSMEIANIIVNNVNKYWKRREFKDFNYIDIEPSNFSIWFAFIFSIIYCTIVGIYVVKNEYVSEVYIDSE